MKKFAKAEQDIVVPSGRAIEASKKMRPLDDVFFNKMGENAGAIEEVISTVLAISVIVREVVPRYTIAEIGSRGVSLDSFATVVSQTRVVWNYFCEACNTSGKTIYKRSKKTYTRRSKDMEIYVPAEVYAVPHLTKPIP